MFDEEPDGDPHGECAAEIHALQALLRQALEALEALKCVITGPKLNDEGPSYRAVKSATEVGAAIRKHLEGSEQPRVIASAPAEHGGAPEQPTTADWRRLAIEAHGSNARLIDKLAKAEAALAELPERAQEPTIVVAAVGALDEERRQHEKTMAVLAELVAAYDQRLPLRERPEIWAAARALVKEQGNE